MRKVTRTGTILGIVNLKKNCVAWKCYMCSLIAKHPTDLTKKKVCECFKYGFGRNLGAKEECKCYHWFANIFLIIIFKSFFAAWRWVNIEITWNIVDLIWIRAWITKLRMNLMEIAVTFSYILREYVVSWFSLDVFAH